MEEETEREQGHTKEWTIQEHTMPGHISGHISYRMSCSHLRPAIGTPFTEVEVCWVHKPQLRLQLSINVTQRHYQAGDALLAVSCRMLHLNSIFCARHLHDGTWDVIIPKHPPAPRKLLKCIWNNRILMWSINPPLCRALISLYK